MKKVLSVIVLAALAVSMTSCGSKAETSGPAVTDAISETTAAEAETTTVTTAAETTTTTAEEPSAAPEETAASETTEAAPAQTTAAGDLDLDAMMSSIEAEIPDITVFTGFNDIDITVTYPKHDGSDEPATTTATSAAATAETTAATTAAPSTTSAPVTDMFSFNFDGVTYKMPVTGSQLQLPAGWTDATTPGRSEHIYDKSGFEGCHIEEMHRGGNTLNGVYIHVVNDLQDGKPVPALSMAGGITWGSTKEDIKAAFGEPARESSFDQFNTTTTALFYSSDEGDTMVLYVPESCGLALIELYRY